MTCDQLASGSDKSLSHTNPALVGTIANISCPPGTVLTGPNMTICMANRSWEPDPESAVCKGESIILLAVIIVLMIHNI